MKTNKLIIIGASLIVILAIAVIYLLIDRNGSERTGYDQNYSPNNRSANIQAEIYKIENRIRLLDKEISSEASNASYSVSVPSLGNNGSYIDNVLESNRKNGENIINSSIRGDSNGRISILRSEREMLIERLKTLYNQQSMVR